ncbi:MAG: hypothetical protein VYE07_01620, partial [Actinomycetota bacterium]|nr:hypothetical protein [Actinomycetota bacterium]
LSHKVNPLEETTAAASIQPSLAAHEIGARIANKARPPPRFMVHIEIFLTDSRPEALHAARDKPERAIKHPRVNHTLTN